MAQIFTASIPESNVTDSSVYTSRFGRQLKPSKLLNLWRDMRSFNVITMTRSIGLKNKPARCSITVLQYCEIMLEFWLHIFKFIRCFLLHHVWQNGCLCWNGRCSKYSMPCIVLYMDWTWSCYINVRSSCVSSITVCACYHTSEQQTVKHYLRDRTHHWGPHGIIVTDQWVLKHWAF